MSKSCQNLKVKNDELPVQWWVAEAINDYATKIFAVTAGLGSGKTHGLCQWLHDRVLRHDFPYFAFMLPTHQLVRNTGIPTYTKVLAQHGLSENIHYEVLKSPQPMIRYCNGREVHFLSANTPNQLVGVEYADGVIDEAGSILEESYQLFRTRVRRAMDGQILMGGVPQGLNYYADLFNDSNPGWIERDTRDFIHLDKQFRRFRLTTFDNPFLPPDYVSQLYDIYGKDSPYILSYVHGIFTALSEGNCYTNYTPVKHVIPDIQADPQRDILLTMDFNACPLAWVSCQMVPEDTIFDRHHVLTAIHNADSSASTLEDAAVEFASKHPPAKYGNTLIKLYGDSSGHAESHKTRQTDYQAMQRYLNGLGYRRVEICAMRYNPLETMTVDALNRMFMNDRCVHCKRCSNLQKSLMGTKWKEGERKIEKKAGEKITHWGDGMKYLAFALTESEGRKVISGNW